MTVHDIPVREAATVVLLRDGNTGIETWLLRRVPKMAFAAGMSVFPGGAVDPGDAGVIAEDAHVHAVAGQLGTSTSHAASLLCAAFRETFEEVGVLLATAAGAGSGSGDAAGIDPTLRAAVENGETSFGALLGKFDLSLDVAALRPWTRWVTPEGESRRYDTYFFVAVVPEGAEAISATTEASHAGWLSIAEALAEYERGERPMLPPTIVTLTEIGGYDKAQDVLAAAGQRSIAAIRPRFGRDESGALKLDLGDGREVYLADGFITASGRTL